MSSPVCTESGFICQSQRCCSLASCAQCSGTDLLRTEMRIAKGVGSERLELLQTLSSCRTEATWDASQGQLRAQKAKFRYLGRISALLQKADIDCLRVHAPRSIRPASISTLSKSSCWPRLPFQSPQCGNQTSTGFHGDKPATVFFYLRFEVGGRL